MRGLKQAACCGLIGLLAIGPFERQAAEAASPEGSAKNVIVLVVDGCGSEQITLARWFRGQPLALDRILVGAVKTYIADSVVADSAPASTAFASGVRTSDKLIGMGPKSGTLPCVPEPDESLQYRPLATVLESARLQGKATGIIATSRVTHATPAAFVAHVPNRGQEQEIAEQLVYQSVDVVLGGGKDMLLPESAGGQRADGEDLWQVLQQRGYQCVETRDELLACGPGKVFGMFAMGPLSPEIDRPSLRPQEPPLAEMTRCAIERLSADPDGFLLMVEGSQVDWACHANDPAYLLGDLLAFDDAVGAALEFAERDGQTLVIALPDHNTGGMTIGNYRTSATYSQMSLEELLGPLRGMKLSAVAIWDKLRRESASAAASRASFDPRVLQRLVEQDWGLAISDELARRILHEAESRDAAYPHNALGRILSAECTCLGWTSHGHVGGDVPLYAFGPGRPAGLVDQPEIAGFIARPLGLDLAATQQRLFAEADSALPGAELRLDRRELANPVLRVTRAGRTAELPLNKNLLRIDGQTIELEGLVVAASAQKVYLPLQAVQAILAENAAAPETAVPESAQARAERMSWWREARFGMFVHWGLYSGLAGTWDGKPVGTRGGMEWIQQRVKADTETYARRAVPLFQPQPDFARQWARLAKDAGCRYLVFTTKHHDGFALHDSQVSDYDAGSVLQRDLVREIVDAARAEGLKVGFYHSVIDWHHDQYAYALSQQLPHPLRGQPYPNGQRDHAAYVKYLHGQAEELASRYGDIDILWWDYSSQDFQGDQAWRATELMELVRAKQPRIIMNNRLYRIPAAGFTGMGTAAIAPQLDSRYGDFITPEQHIPDTGMPGVDWETCMTMNTTWGYSEHDHEWKSDETLIRNLVDIASKGGNYLLNIGPRADGSVPEESVRALHAIGAWMQVNGESIWATDASPFEKLPWGRCTRKRLDGGATRLYLHVFDWPADGRLVVPLVPRGAMRARLLATGASLPVAASDGGVVVAVPADASDRIASVIALDIDGAVETRPPAR